jgi:SAM-dependent methyltransferase
VSNAPYQLHDGVYLPTVPVTHREVEYGSHGFEVLSKMQSRHFWYRGRHRFLNYAVHHYYGASAAVQSNGAPARAIDLGGGCGGWVKYFDAIRRFRLAEFAMGDSSMVALEYAARSLPPDVARYQIDLLNLQWNDRWELAFLLDVLEHIPDDKRALKEIYRALSPGGLLFVTTPALNCFWSWNDDLALHQRRYSRTDLKRLAQECGYRLLDVRYFMFCLSPLLVASRFATSPKVKSLSNDEQRRMLEDMHRVPHPLINELLSTVFACETPLGHYVPFPWGTSILAVLEKPCLQSKLSTERMGAQ